MSIVQGTLPVGSLDKAITLNVQSSGESHFETVTDTTPYLHRASPQDVASIMKLKKVVGGTIAWNQLQKNTTTRSNNGIDYTYSDGSLNIKGKATNSSYWLPSNASTWNFYANHVYLWNAGNESYVGSSAFRFYPWGYTNKYFDQPYEIWKPTTGQTSKFINVVIGNGTELDITVKPQLFDLTQMFGSTIADYIYSLEQAHEGDGVAWFKALFGEDYYSYNAGELLSVKTSARKTYNADNVEIGSYPLDSDLELRGIPKLDSNNELYYDGDTYASDGTVTRKYGTVTFDGSETWYYDSNNALAYTIVTNGIIVNSQTQHNVYVANDNAGLKNESWAGRSVADGTIGMYYGQTRIFVKKSTITSNAEAKAYFTSNPTNVIYALATSTTESADAYTESQRVGATEEFVDGRTVEMPVGNVSEYKRLIQEDEP